MYILNMQYPIKNDGESLREFTFENYYRPIGLNKRG